MSSLEQKLAFLRRPQSYPHAPASVDVIETHFAWVFLAGSHVYKLKKPMVHGRMDYRTLALREAGCRAELRLNRRLAPEVYEAVVPLCSGPRGLVLGEGARVEDWLVRMKRLPESRMLDRALLAGEVRSADLQALAATLARFFRSAEPAAVPPRRYLAQLDERLSGTLAGLEHHATRIPVRTARAVVEALRSPLHPGATALLQRAGSVVEGHGDLRAEHVCLGPPVSVIDCLEFDVELRRLDPAEEIAFLCMEMGLLGREDASSQLWQACVEQRVVPDDPGLFHYYAAHRALMRALLAAWHLGDPQFPDPAPWVARTTLLLDCAGAHAREARERLARAGGGPKPVQPSEAGQR